MPRWWLAEQLPHPTELRCRLILELEAEIRARYHAPNTRLLPVCDSFEFNIILQPHEEPSDD